MSAECNRCGNDIVYPEGTWPIGVCPVCTRYPKTPVDCLISELRDTFVMNGMDGRAYLLKEDFEARVAQFKSEIAE